MAETRVLSSPAARPCSLAACPPARGRPQREARGRKNARTMPQAPGPTEESYQVALEMRRQASVSFSFGQSERREREGEGDGPSVRAAVATLGEAVGSLLVREATGAVGRGRDDDGRGEESERGERGNEHGSGEEKESVGRRGERRRAK